MPCGSGGEDHAPLATNPTILPRLVPVPVEEIQAAFRAGATIRGLMAKYGGPDTTIPSGDRLAGRDEPADGEPARNEALNILG